MSLRPGDGSYEFVTAASPAVVLQERPMNQPANAESAKTFPAKIANELSYVESVLDNAARALADVAGRNHGHGPEGLSRGQTGEAAKPVGMFDQVDAQICRVRELAHQLRDQAFSLNATH